MGGAGVPMGPSPGLALRCVGVISDLGRTQEREIHPHQKNADVFLDPKDTIIAGVKTFFSTYGAKKICIFEL